MVAIEAASSQSRPKMERIVIEAAQARIELETSADGYRWIAAGTNNPEMIGQHMPKPDGGGKCGSH